MKIILKLNKHADSEGEENEKRIHSTHRTETENEKESENLTKITFFSIAVVVVAIAAVWFETNPNVNNRLSSIVLRSTLDVYLINVTFVNWASGEKRKRTKKINIRKQSKKQQ